MKCWKRFCLFVGACVCSCFASQPCGGETRWLTDMAGRNVSLPSKVERMITTFKPAALCVLSLGLCDKLVGIDTNSKKDRLQLVVHPETARLPGVGSKTSGLNLETIIHLKPDLVLLYSQKEGIRIADRLVEHGIPALVILPETFEGILTTLRLIAEAMGEPERAERVFRENERVLHLVRERVRDIPGNGREVVYFASSLGVFSTATGSLLQDDIIRQAGGVNAGHALTGYFREISPEQFIQWNPDLVALSIPARAQAAQTLTRPEFQQVSAVSKGQVYVFPSNLAPWDFPSPLSTLGVLWLAKRLYPERFKDIPLMEEIDRYHQTLFQKTFTAMGGELNDRLEP